MLYKRLQQVINIKIVYGGKEDETMDSHLDTLQKQFNDIHPSIILKTDVLREGVKPSPLFEKIADWAATDPHWLFEWSHDDVYHEQNVRPEKHLFPDLFEFREVAQMLPATTLKTGNRV